MKTIAEDRFERYYAEKLWEMIPAIYRHEDGIAERPGVLRGLVEVIAEQAAIVRRSEDRLWEDQFIEWCSDWAVPYIADLLGTRLISALNKRGRRVDVAKTIYYRRRKGTPRILEELISDITGWDGRLVESFQRLARARHGLDTVPGLLLGPFTGTGPGGWADLRRQRGSELNGGPFDEYFHTADFRRQQGKDGRYGIPRLNFHIYRLVAYKVANVTPFSLGDDMGFCFDPSGRDIQLFNRRRRPEDWEEWHAALEWELPAPMRCRLLAHAEYLISEAVVQRLVNDHGLLPGAAADLRSLRGWQFREEGRLLATLATLPTQADLLAPGIYVPLLRYAIIAACGKQALLPNALAVEGGGITPDTGSLAVTLGAPPAGIITAEFITAANLSNWAIGPGNKRLAIDPERGRLLWLDGAVDTDELTVSYHYGFAAPLGAGTYDRPAVEEQAPDLVKQGGGVLAATDILNNGITQISDSKTYGPVSDKLSVQHLEFRAANLQRPFLRLEANWILNTGTNEESTLTIDGWWIGASQNNTLEVILRGDYETVHIRNCTFDPGGDTNILGGTLHPVTLVIEGFVEQLCIEDSIMGPVIARNDGTVETITICDSIIQSVNAGSPAIAVNTGMVILQRTTVFGNVNVHRLQATETIITGPSTVTDTQNGCFRFSAAPAFSRLPRPYESFLFTVDTNHWFSSRRFGHYSYAQLSETAPEPLRTGAENGSEMGAFNSLLNPVKLDGLRAKIDEYMPFGLIPAFIHET
ncbi:hypothetical protein [Chitinophaga sp. CF418]|uniref:hypothetical protein n=1 Tax=Chitinophaga sp. CF418 TaxID=1855287 RepID=UPI00091B19F0|nr:hypothetical protein [Chitinophaga sp. CF418]SHN40787.1 hypothetical protein SAMN05216311_112108 [Chitinophaga sp. CF418]